MQPRQQLALLHYNHRRRYVIKTRNRRMYVRVQHSIRLTSAARNCTLFSQFFIGTMRPAFKSICRRDNGAIRRLKFIIVRCRRAVSTDLINVIYARMHLRSSPIVGLLNHKGSTSPALDRIWINVWVVIINI